MSEFNMSDAFVLPVSSHKGDLFNSKNPIGDTRICKFFNMNQFESAKLAAHAINSHDKLVEENKRLRGALESSKNKLVECAQELNCMIDMNNAELESGISSTDENPPDYFDSQTVHECMVQSRLIDEALSREGEL